jgi:dTDP-4-dehydrorhamnose reductase
MRILVLGSDGMLGHRLVRGLGARHQVTAASRRDADVRDMARVRGLLGVSAAEAVVNAVGVIPQRRDGGDAAENIEVNALFPHLLARACGDAGARLVHVSTDCVFSGLRGQYREEDPPDPVDLYGRSKLLGEVEGAATLTLRTSLIGPSPARGTGLVEWFLAQRGPVRGYRNAVFSGLTTVEFTRVIEHLLARPPAGGLYHLSAAPISKLDLLTRLRDRLGLDTPIEPEDEPRVDRSLDSSRFRAAFGYEPPSWDAMLDELAAQMKKPDPSRDRASR